MYPKAKLRSFRLSLFLIILFPCWQILSAQQTYEFPYQNPALTFGARVNDLVGRMTIDEKISQMMNSAPAVDRLGIPAYDWWNECLYGVGRAGQAAGEALADI